MSRPSSFFSSSSSKRKRDDADDSRAADDDDNEGGGSDPGAPSRGQDEEEEEIVISDDDDDVVDTSPHLLGRSLGQTGTSSSPTTVHSFRQQSAAKATPGPLPNDLRMLIDTVKFSNSNPVKWFSMVKLQQKAAEIAALCNQPGGDQYTTKVGAVVTITRQCGCMIPSPKGKKERPEIKITQPFVVSAAQKTLILQDGQKKFSKSTMKVSANNSILITKAVRMHSVMYAAHHSVVWDTQQKIGNSMTQMEVSHLCNNGQEGCVNPVHLSLEPKSINLDRRWCWLAVKCAVPNCTGMLTGNACQGHGNKPDGTPYPRCIRPTLSVPCPHYTGHAAVAALPP